MYSCVLNQLRAEKDQAEPFTNEWRGPVELTPAVELKWCVTNVVSLSLNVCLSTSIVPETNDQTQTLSKSPALNRLDMRVSALQDREVCMRDKHNRGNVHCPHAA